MTGAQLDHLVVAARTLDEGRAWLEQRLGVPLENGGEHVLFGTHNRLLSLGPDAYLEVIAVNPAAPTPGRPRWFALDEAGMQRRLQDGPALIHWVVTATGDVNGDVRHGEALRLSRGRFEWTLTVPDDGHLPGGGVWPSQIQWWTSSPARSLTDRGVRLAGLRLFTPEHTVLQAHLEALNFDGPVQVEPVEAGEAPVPRLQATLLTPAGKVVL